MQFKIGQKVRIIEADHVYNENYRGMEGVISSAEYGGWMIDGDKFKTAPFFFEHELELVEEKREFKVGDRVRVTKCKYDTPYHVNQEGITVQEEGNICAKFVNGDVCLFDEAELIPTKKEVKQEKAEEENRPDSFAESIKQQYLHDDLLVPGTGGWRGIYEFPASRYIIGNEKYIGTWDNSQPKKTIMKTLSVLAKKTFDTDTRVLIETEYLTGDLELTGRGQNALLNLLFLENKKALALEARKFKREQKKCEEDEE